MAIYQIGWCGFDKWLLDVVCWKQLVGGLVWWFLTERPGWLAVADPVSSLTGQLYEDALRIEISFNCYLCCRAMI